MIIYDINNNQLLDIMVDDRSCRIKEITGENKLYCYFSASNPISLPLYCWCEYRGERYFLMSDQKIKKIHSENHEYELEMDTHQAFLKELKYEFFTVDINGDINSDREIEFSLNVTPIEYLRLLINNMNLKDASGGWTVGECIESEPVLLDFNDAYCWDVLGQIAEAFNTEWEIDVKTIHLRKVEKMKDNPLPLMYGKGNGLLPGIERTTVKNAIGAVRVKTSDRNIDKSRYGSKTLKMPKNYTINYNGIDYITDNSGSIVKRKYPLTASPILVEETLDLTKIYPKREGVVTEVIEVDDETCLYDFVDNDNPIDYSDKVIAGETMTVIFQDGKMPGMELDVNYKHDEKKFELVPITEQGLNYPQRPLIPETGNKYAVFHIQLPDEYIREAEMEVLNEAVKYLYENEQPQYSYSAKLDELFSKSKWLEIGGYFNIGNYVRFSEPQYLSEPVDIRIVSVKDFINSPYSPEIELSNSVVGQSLGSKIANLPNKDQTVERKNSNTMSFTKRRWRDAVESLGMIEKAIDGFSDSINPITIQTMAMLVGDERLQFRFVDNKTNPSEVLLRAGYNQEDKEFSVQSSILQHMTIGINKMSSDHQAEEYKYWDMSAYTSPYLDEPEALYLYAKCEKETTSGTFLLSKDALEMDAGNYYCFLVGTLSSEYNDERSFVTLYGFTEILPGRITVPLIISPDGKTYFNIAEGEIGGKIKFTGGSSGLENLAEWPGLNQSIKDAKDAADAANDAVNDLGGYIDGAFADGIIDDAEAAAIEKYINQINNAKLAVEATYNQLFVNPYLSGTPKTSLMNAKVTLFGTIDNLIATINTAISDGKATEAEKQDVDRKFATYNSAMADFNKAVENAYKAIQDALKTFADDATRIAQEAEADARNAMDAANAANAAIAGLEDLIDDAFADGVIDEAEAIAIEKYINQVNNAKLSVEATYNQLFVNPYLSGTPKTALMNAKISLFGTIDDLIASINTAIADGKATEAEKQDVDRKFAAYNSAMADFNKAVENAYKAIQDTIKSYTDEALLLAQQANASATNALNAANAANTAVNDLGGYINGAFADGIIDEAEAAAIEKYLNTINAQKAAVEATYNKLYANSYLAGTAKSNLLNAKISLFGAISNLISIINSAIADDKITATEKRNVDSYFSLFGSAMADFNTAVEAANKAIQDALKGFADSAEQLARDASTSASNALTAANAAKQAAATLEDYIDGAFADGIIDEAEAVSIQKYLNTINNTKQSVTATYETLYANNYLTGTPKTALNSAYTAFNTACTNLINAINSAIADGKATSAEKTTVNNRFTTFNTAINTFYTAVENANRAIQEKIMEVAIQADQKADNALQNAENASNAANNAMGVANTKAKVFYQTAAPTTGMKANDLWVDGINIYRYNGSSWVLASRYDQTITEINGGLITTGAIAFGSTGGMAASGSIRIWAGGNSGANGQPPSDPTFSVDSSGNVLAKGSFRLQNNLAGITGEGTSSSSIRIWAGGATPASAPFRVTQGGRVTATDAEITGKITAISGVIGGFTIAADRLYSTPSDIDGNAFNFNIYSNGKAYLGYTQSTNTKVLFGASIDDEHATEDGIYPMLYLRDTNPVTQVRPLKMGIRMYIRGSMINTMIEGRNDYKHTLGLEFIQFVNETNGFTRGCFKSTMMPVVTSINTLNNGSQGRYNVKWDKESGYLYVE